MSDSREPTSPRSGHKVLIVEDSKAIASLLHASIGQIEGIDVLLAGDLAETRRLLAASGDEIFVAVLDLNLPDAPDGEVVDEVQALGIPVIILTGQVDDEKRKALFRRNIADYISKGNLGGVGAAVKLVERIWHNRESQILVVDDSPSQRSLLCALLHNHGYQTLEAGNGQEGLKLLQAHPGIRLVLTDHHMPVMDGLSMTGQIRRFRSGDELAIIALSGAEEETLLPRYLKSGADDFLRKPFEIEELYCRIDRNLDMLRHIAEARDAANRDYLTGLYNRRYFFSRAVSLHEQAMRGKVELMAAMIDADHFKAINDTHGHHVGDLALKAMARVLQDFAEEGGFPSRFGGEEFVCLQVIREGVDPAARLESLRAAVEAIELRGEGGQRVPLTVSIGGTTFAGNNIDEMLGVADEAVYLAKTQGRNRVVILDRPSGAGSAGTAVRTSKR
ncbi:MAG: diguanylate cyclase [Gammaproteobacteria bacterium]|nr:MAG: diguanylate cyclase [Gammaproteobacteria bacterium]